MLAFYYFVYILKLIAFSREIKFSMVGLYHHNTIGIWSGSNDRKNYHNKLEEMEIIYIYVPELVILLYFSDY